MSTEPSSQASSTPAPGAVAPVRRWAVLGVLCASLLLVGIDLTVLHVAVPTISRQLLPSTSQLLWIVDIYPLTVAALLVTFGTLADRWGRKRLVLGGFVVFGLASVGAAASATAVQLILARAALGVGAAMMMAATVAIIRNVFVTSANAPSHSGCGPRPTVSVPPSPRAGRTAVAALVVGSSVPGQRARPAVLRDPALQLVKNYSSCTRAWRWYLSRWPVHSEP